MNKIALKENYRLVFSIESLKCFPSV